MEIFKTALYVGYEIVFGAKSPGDRLQFLNGIPLRHVLYEIAGLNHRLKPAIEKEFKTQFLDQLKELEYFCGFDQTKTLPYQAAMSRTNTELNNRRGGGSPIMFSRPTNLFALQEVLDRMPDKDDPGFKWNSSKWESLLKYYLCVNDVISEYKKQDEDVTHSPFEKLTAGSGFLNELTVVNDPLLTISRFTDLFEFVSNDKQLSAPLASHFAKIGITAGAFLRHIFSMCFMHKADQEALKFCYQLNRNNPTEKEAFKIFDYFSRRNLIPKIHELDLIELKKSPVFKDIKDYYIIFDNTYLIEKSYELFLNDFWFESVKPVKIDIRDYKGKIGRFFEQYVCSLLKDGLKFLKHPPIKCLDELKVSINGNLVELGDVYCRQNRKVLLGEIKSSGIYNDQQYGTAQSLFRNKEDYIYEVFGLHQLVKNIQLLRDYPEKFDASFPKRKPVQVFPVIIVNEKIFQTPFFPAMFHLKFKSEIEKLSLGSLKIKPLTLIHVSDVERMTYHLRKRKIGLWDLLKSNYEGSIFPKPFNITLNRKKLNPDYSIAQKKLVRFGVINQVRVDLNGV